MFLLEKKNFYNFIEKNCIFFLSILSEMWICVNFDFGYTYKQTENNIQRI